MLHVYVRGIRVRSGLEPVACATTKAMLNFWSSFYGSHKYAVAARKPILLFRKSDSSIALKKRLLSFTDNYAFDGFWGVKRNLAPRTSSGGC
jgi:hypothetical protein